MLGLEGKGILFAMFAAFMTSCVASTVFPKATWGVCQSWTQSPSELHAET